MLLKMSRMPPGLTVAVMTVVVMVSGEMNMAEPDWSNACKGPVCGVAEKQAEGLARLRVMSDYIKETMGLMESVIASLDEEMVEVAQELNSVVGRRCHSRTLQALTPLINRRNYTGQTHESENIIEATSDSEDWSSRGMTQGSTSTMSGNVDTVLGNPYSTAHHTPQSQHPSTTTYSTSHSTSQYPSTPHSPSTASHNTGKTSHRPSTSDKYVAQPSATTSSVYVAPEQPGEVGRWQGGSGRWQGGRGQGSGRRQDGGGGRGGGRGQGWGRGEGQGRGGGHGRGRNQNRARDDGGSVSQLSGCRGVPVGSPHYVPGLDSWCKRNCPLGMCPANQCVC